VILTAQAPTFSWSGFFVDAAAFTATIVSLGALLTAVEVILRRWPSFRRWALSAPLRVATQGSSRSSKRSFRPDDLRVLDDEFGSIRDFRQLIKRLIFRNESELAAGFILADILAEPPAVNSHQDETHAETNHEINSMPNSPIMATAGLRGEHHWTRLAPVLLRVFSTAARQRSTRLIARILYPEDVRIYSKLFRDLAQAVRQLAVSAPVAFERYRPAVGEHINDGKSGLASFVTAFSGSIVLADAAESRSKCAEQVLVWHSRRFHRGFRVNEAKESTDYLNWRYEDTHRDGVGCTKWGSGRRIGDFDQRVLHLRSVALAEATAEDGLSIVLETSETCYGISEDGKRGMGCKNVTVRLTPDDSQDEDNPFYKRPRSVETADDKISSDYRIVRLNPDAGRITLLTAQLALISADDKLILQHRTGSVRHDASMIGASAGGVISLGGITPSGDLDSAGWPDPTAAVAREAQEEIGVEMPPAACRPVCVYLLNVANDGNGNPPSGQLGAAILYIARTSLDSHEIINAAKTNSDQARGRFEQSGLALCPTDSSKNMALWMADNAARLSIHALMACTYSSLISFGREETQAALSAAFMDRPWWAISPYSQPIPRLVRDPRSLMQSGCIDEVGPKAWATAWQKLEMEPAGNTVA
jgi:hypothetical protein